MKTVQEYIDIAKRNGYTIQIKDMEGYWDLNPMGSGWFMWGELGWTKDLTAFDNSQVVRADLLPELILIVEVAS